MVMYLRLGDFFREMYMCMLDMDCAVDADVDSAIAGASSVLRLN